MSRSPIAVRDAEPNDAAALLRVWNDQLRRTTGDRPSRPRLSEVRSALARIAVDPDQRLMVAVVDDEVIGAALLSRTPLSPVSTDDAVQVSHLQVLEHARRHGAGKALMECAVSWAEEKGASTVMATATSGDREANRYLARLGFGSLAIVRAASVSSLRAGMLPLEPPPCARTDVRTSRTVGQILAQRRQQRRTRPGPS
ncbi:MAG TPA: GNAT family N-acetyltransferase [Nocardioidaceae bacterium]|nr:GNAT family N-acetyltransferase [Nocardioidaceae bacterium]